MAQPLGTQPGPHLRIPAADAKERFALELFDALWDQYRRRVTHVAAYERLIADTGATFVNDHVAFRTFASQQPHTGIASVARVFEALGYRAAACYDFADKHLGAVHYQHPNLQFPKLFVSELRTWELSDGARAVVRRSLATHRAPVSEEILAAFRGVGDLAAEHRDGLLQAVVRQFQDLPWGVPEKEDVEAVNRESQYAAWVLVHGYNVNHFTSLVNSHGVSELDDIEKTVDSLRRVGVPVKAEIEGERGSKLRQTATEAAVVDVPVRVAGRPARMPWTYAYFEFAERGDVTDPATGKAVRFEGFLGPQATQLFEMTRLAK